MKKIISSVIALGLGSYINAQDINIPNSGWHLLGASEDLNVSKFDSTCVDYIWKYDISGNNPEWQLHKANNNITTSYNGATISSLNAGDGFWAKSQSSCDINTTTASVVDTQTTFYTITSNDNWRVTFENFDEIVMKSTNHSASTESSLKLTFLKDVNINIDVESEQDNDIFQLFVDYGNGNIYENTGGLSGLSSMSTTGTANIPHEFRYTKNASIDTGTDSVTMTIKDPTATPSYVEDNSGDIETLSDHNWAVIFKNISIEEQNRLKARIITASGAKSHDAVESGYEAFYEYKGETSCDDVGGYYTPTATTENGITKTTYTLGSTSHEAYCTEYSYSNTAEGYGSYNYSSSYYKTDFTTDDVTPPTTGAIPSEDLNYSGYVAIVQNEYATEYNPNNEEVPMCEGDNQYLISTGTLTCSDFPTAYNNNKCYLTDRAAGTGSDCVTLSSDGYYGTTK